MEFSVHLFAGLVLGLVIFSLVKNRHVVAICTFGSVLPDIGDKGYYILSSSGWVTFGMINFHSIYFLILSILAAAVGWIFLRTHAFVALSAGIILHHILDEMWLKPQIWLEMPFRSPDVTYWTLKYLLRVLRSDVGSPGGMLLILTTAAIFILLYASSIRSAIRTARRYF